jgi:hypothetical protein
VFVQSGILDQQISIRTEPSEPTVASPPTLPTELMVETTNVERLDTGASHAAVSGILATFVSLSSNFTFPSRLEFVSSSSDSPKLAYTPTNASLHQYEHVLTGLLTRLDAVESFGDEEVRKVRKEAVKRIERELEDLDRRKLEEWKRQSATAAEPEVESQSEAEGLPAEVDPRQVPLPQGEEDEQMDGTTPESPVAVLATTLSPSHSTLTLPPTATEQGQMSLTEAPASEISDSEAEEYVDVDLISATSTDEGSEEAERTNDLTAMDEWDLDF